MNVVNVIADYDRLQASFESNYLENLIEAVENRLQNDAKPCLMLYTPALSKADVEGAFVVWYRPGRNDKIEYGVHWYSSYDGGLHQGNYDLESIDAALNRVERRSGKNDLYVKDHMTVIDVMHNAPREGWILAKLAAPDENGLETILVRFNKDDRRWKQMGVTRWYNSRAFVAWREIPDDGWYQG